jgi:hypothetical protein
MAPDADTIRHRAHDHAGNGAATMRSHDDQVAAQFSGHPGDHLGRLTDMDVRRMKPAGSIELFLGLDQLLLALFQIVGMQRFLADMGLDPADRNRRMDVQQVDFRHLAEPGAWAIR